MCPSTFPTLAVEGERASRLFNIDIEATFRDWMTDMLGPEKAEALIREKREMPRYSTKLGAWDGPDLSSRERECISLLACGYQRREIAAELGLGLETVRQYLGRAYFKLRAANGNHAIVLAALVGELDHRLIREHVLRTWDGIAA